MRKFLFSILMGFVLLYGSVQTSFAAVKSGDSVIVAPNETINETLFTSGQQISIEGTINGDLICGGQTIRVEGTVNGDVLCAGQNITIEGPVNGNVRVAGQTLDIKNSVARNVMFFGQSLTIEPEASISGELFIGAQSTAINGSIAKQISGGGQHVMLNGMVGGNTNLTAEQLEIGKNATVSGNIVYTSKNKAQVAEGGTVSGSLTQKMPKITKSNPRIARERFMQGARIFGKATSFVTLLFSTLILVLLFPKFTQTVLSYMNTKTLSSFLWGVAILFGTPVLLVVLFITIIGIPLSLFLLMVYIVLLMIARAFAAMIVGDQLFKTVRKTQKTSVVISAAVGVVILWIVFQIPLIGWLASFLSLLWGLGAFGAIILNKIRHA